MTDAFRIMGLGVIVALMCCVIRDHTSVMAVALSLAGCIGILLLSIEALRPVLGIIARLQSLSGLTTAVVAPMIKVTGIGMLTQICSAVCEDAGEKTLHNAVQIGGTFLSLYVSVPLMSAVLDLLEEMLGR